MESSLSLSEKYELILANERQLAKNVAAEVVDRPELAMWMILIPVFFVFYFFQLKRYQNSLKDFIRHFLMTRKRVLDATYEAAELETVVDVDALVEVTDAPEETKDEYRFWVATLVEFFQKLIQAQGVTYPELVKSGLKNRTSYLLAVNKLNNVERTFHKALTPLLPDDDGDITNIVKTMEQSVEKFRKEQVKEIFPQ